MRILLVDRSTESQAALAKQIGEFDPADMEALDITVRLAGLESYQERLSETDVVIIGPDAEECARELSSKIRTVRPDMEIIVVVTDESYSRGTFRLTHQVRARKILPTSFSSMDILQELTLIQQSFKQSGKIRDCRVIAVTQAKGSVGATSVCAALAELFSNNGKKVLLWDLDIETQDLTRALSAGGMGGRIVSAWFSDSRPLTRESFQDALQELGNNAFLLSPPDDFNLAVRMMGESFNVVTINRILDLARASFDVVIIDTVGRLSAATESLLEASDLAMLVVEDSLLGLSAAAAYLNALSIVLQGTDRVRILCSGINLKQTDIVKQLDPGMRLGSRTWQLPAIPFDKTVGRWPCSGNTIYSMGSRSTKRVLEQIGTLLGVTDQSKALESKLTFFPGGKQKTAEQSAANGAPPRVRPEPNQALGFGKFLTLR